MEIDAEPQLTQNERDSFFAPLPAKPQLPMMKYTSVEFVPQAS